MIKKRILFIGRLPPPIHGASVMNEKYLEMLGNDKRFTIRKIKINCSESLDQIGRVSFKKFFYTLISYMALIKELLFFRPKLIYFEIAPKGVAFLRDSIYIIMCKILRIKIVFHMHAKGVSKFANKNYIIKWFYKFIFKNTRVILLSKLLYHDVENIVSKKQIRIVPNGISDNIPDTLFEKVIAKRNKNKKVQLLFLSNMIESKGPIDVLNICRELKNEKKKFECLFVGKFQQEDFKYKFLNEIKKLELGKECKYIGPKYGEDKYKILGKTNYLIFPTKYEEECSPLVILEAFSYGIPVFSYNNGAIGEIISKSFLGYVSKHARWEELVSNLIINFGNRSSSREIREEFKNKYTLYRSGVKLKAILDE